MHSGADFVSSKTALGIYVLVVTSQFVTVEIVRKHVSNVFRMVEFSAQGVLNFAEIAGHGIARFVSVNAISYLS